MAKKKKWNPITKRIEVIDDKKEKEQRRRGINNVSDELAERAQKVEQPQANAYTQDAANVYDGKDAHMQSGAQPSGGTAPEQQMYTEPGNGSVYDGKTGSGNPVQVVDAQRAADYAAAVRARQNDSIGAQAQEKVNEGLNNIQGNGQAGADAARNNDETQNADDDLPRESVVQEQEQKPAEKISPYTGPTEQTAKIDNTIKAIEKLPVEDKEKKRLEELKESLNERYGNKYDALLADPETAPAIIEALEKYDEAKKAKPTEKQEKMRKIYDILNAGTAGLAELGTAIGLSINANKGPVGGAVKAPDLHSGAAESAEKAQKRFDDAAKDLRDAQDQLGDAVVKASVYQYKKKSEREKSEQEAKDKADALKFKQAESDRNYALKVAAEKRKDEAHDAYMKKVQAEIKAANAKTAESKAAKKGQQISIRVGFGYDDNGNLNEGVDVNINKDKWNAVNVSKLFGLLSKEAKESIYDKVKKESKNANAFQLLNGTPDALSENMLNYELMQQMQFCIGQWIDAKGCEQAKDFLLSLVSGEDYDPDDDLDFREDKGNKRKFK